MLSAETQKLMKEAFAGHFCKCGAPANRHVKYEFLCYDCFDKMKRGSRRAPVGPVELREVKDPQIVRVKRLR